MINLNKEIYLNIIRNKCVHLLGYAIKQIWSNLKISKYNIIDNGFYYDIYFNNFFHINKLIILENYINKLSLNKIDCIYFKLKTIKYIYWENNPKIRIFGTAWGNLEELKYYLKNIILKPIRDHRILGNILNLYFFNKNSPGMVFWQDNGLIIFNVLKNLISLKLKKNNYKLVKTPLIMDRKIWEKTGHWDNYYQYIYNIFLNNKNYCIKPMNCPGHIQMFKYSLKSYKDLPLRIAEFGNCYRYESSGSLQGLMRLREFTQDDAHIFCTENQLYEEINNCISFIFKIYNLFNFKKINLYLSTSPKNFKNFIYKKAEKILLFILINNKINFNFKYGDGAFYGPKIEFILLDSLNRAWQCGTVQLDYLLPKILNIFYLNKFNKKKNPIIIHRAILGSIERFIGIIIEEYWGYLPIWLSPIQIIVLNITNKQFNYVKYIYNKIFKANIRVKYDLRNILINLKIKEYTLMKIPYILICGEKEKKSNTITVRTGKGINLGNYNINNFIKKIIFEINNLKKN